MRKYKNGVVSQTWEEVFGLPRGIRISFDWFELLALYDCIKEMYDKKLFTSYVWENHSFTAKEKIERAIDKRTPKPKEKKT